IEVAARFGDQADIVNLPQLVAADPNVIPVPACVPANVQWNAVRSARGSSLSKVTVMSGKSRMNPRAISKTGVGGPPFTVNKAFSAKNAATLFGFWLHHAFA